MTAIFEVFELAMNKFLTKIALLKTVYWLFKPKRAFELSKVKRGIQLVLEQRNGVFPKNFSFNLTILAFMIYKHLLF